MRLESACQPVFARHETFQPRYGWVRKAVEAAENDRAMFNRDDAVIQMGVGKNMVRSIRFWGLAFKVLSEVRTPRVRQVDTAPSRFGAALFGASGSGSPR